MSTLRVFLKCQKCGKESEFTERMRIQSLPSLLASTQEEWEEWDDIYQRARSQLINRINKEDQARVEARVKAAKAGWNIGLFSVTCESCPKEEGC